MSRKTVLKMSDLAKLAGVSKATVSRALNNSELINIETRQRIQDLAREHNYRLNTRARNFRTKEILTIAVVIPSAHTARWQLAGPFFQEMLGIISMTLMEQGHQLLLSSVNLRELDRDGQFLHRINCDGLIVIGQNDIHEQLNALAKSTIPMVVWGAKMDEQDYVSVGGNNEEGGYLATRHLIERGCASIAVIGDWEVPEGRLRYAGYQRALAEAGLKENPDLAIHTGSDKDEGYQAVLKLLQTNIEFDGLFTLTDALAMKAISALDEKSRKVPKDIAVVGYDDIPLAKYYTPSLTTIHQDPEFGGRLLVDKVLQQIHGEHPHSEILPTPLVVRNSSGRQG